ncbi:AtpZ/AtpI family protein [Aliibacillus thermotolerans]|uniref:AtpZ/AtpI family protein n=1 Tax=Aliibacillus thermotolerans TaxID=1834418 RepID=A0ABW0U7P9_9BACI|nr:AtpZ/AtpI family protein [Aliibacillus thermotolerans]MDA3129967.1 hypothetical protein [Aliibacillus thermotolerans]
MAGKNKPSRPLRSMALASSILSYLVGPVLVGVFGGRWLDGKFATEPLFLVIGLLAGLMAGVYGLVRLLKQYLGDDNHEDL